MTLNALSAQSKIYCLVVRETSISTKPEAKLFCRYW